MKFVFIFIYLSGIAKHMDLHQLKKELLLACIAEIDERAESLEKVMQDAQQSANEYGQPKDRYDSYRTQLLRKRDMFGQQLQKIIEQRKLLDKINLSTKNDAVSFGSLVITDQQKIFVCVGLGRFAFMDEDYFVISPGVPFFQAMEGKKPGDTFSFRDQSYTIKEIA